MNFLVPEILLLNVSSLSKNVNKSRVCVQIISFDIEDTLSCLRSGHKVIKLVSFSTQLSMKFLNAHKYKNMKKFSFLQAQISLEYYSSCSLMLKCQQLLAF